MDIALGILGTILVIGFIVLCFWITWTAVRAVFGVFSLAAKAPGYLEQKVRESQAREATAGKYLIVYVDGTPYYKDQTTGHLIPTNRG